MRNWVYLAQDSDYMRALVNAALHKPWSHVLKRRRECGTYLATARRHRRRLKMQNRDE